MSRDFDVQSEQQIEAWTGILPPNEVARAWAAHLGDLVASFEALRGTMEFDDEPSSFEAALQATKE